MIMLSKNVQPLYKEWIGENIYLHLGYSHLSDTEAPKIPTNSKAPKIPTIFFGWAPIFPTAKMDNYSYKRAY